jgi:hypothetical protein
MQAKLSNRGITCVFVGYTEHHLRDVHRMLNLTKNSVINSCDVIWLNNTYKNWKNAETTDSANDKETIELLTGIEKTK